MREGKLDRVTKETSISVKVKLDGTGKYNIRVRWTREIVRFRLVFRFERGV